jgi:pimeloyl-ACP methyl ester carboxylesterase
MPLYHRGQNARWSDKDYEVIAAEGVSSVTGSDYCRVPRRGSALEAHMMALTPTTVIRGFREALAGCPELADRSKALLLYWGFSTGGAFLWPLAKHVTPDGIAGFGMSNYPVALYATRAAKGNHNNLYEKSALRVRERGRKDFAFFSAELPDDERERQWQEALRSPRFKSFEDTFMFFNVGALSESIARLWFSGDLPDDVRRRGFADLLKANLDLAFPDSALANVRVLNLTGTDDEIQPPAVVRGVSAVVRPYCRTYKSMFLEGLHHSISHEQARLFGSVWLDAIAAHYFSPS